MSTFQCEVVALQKIRPALHAGNDRREERVMWCVALSPRGGEERDWQSSCEGLHSADVRLSFTVLLI